MTNRHNLTKGMTQEKYLQKLRRHKHFIFIVQILILAGFFLLWECSADFGWINDFIFSSPSRMIKAAFLLHEDGVLWRHLTITIIETMLSFLLVALFSLGCAILLWWNQTVCEISEPYLVILNSLPKSAMAPIFIVWLGTGMTTILVTGISVAIFGSILSLYTGFLSTDPDKIKLIRTLRGSKKDCLFKVILPLNLPSILSTLKVDIGLCLIGVIIGEFLAAKEGLGYLIIYGSQVMKLDWVMFSITLLCIIAAILYKAINSLEKKISGTLSEEA